MSSEQRGCKRIPIQLEAYWNKESSQQLVRIANLSLSGCFIKAVYQPVVGATIDLELRLPSGGWIALEGIVVRTQSGQGFGVRFTSKENGSLAAFLGNLLKKSE